MKVLTVAALIIGLLGISQISADKSIDGLIPLAHEAFGEPKVEINLSGSLFKFIGRAACEEDPELGKFLMELKDLHVRIFNPEQMHGKIVDVVRHFERRLKKEGWEIIARIREENSNVGVYVLGDEESINGLFVMISGEREDFVLVNMAGNIDLAQVSKIGEIAGVDLDLPNLDPTKLRPTEEQQKQIEEHRKSAIQSIQDGRFDNAIANLKQIPMIIGDSPEDFGLLAVLCQQQGNIDMTYYYLGRIYEARHHSSFARQLYQYAERLNPDNPLIREKLSR